MSATPTTDSVATRIGDLVGQYECGHISVHCFCVSADKMLNELRNMESELTALRAQLTEAQQERDMFMMGCKEKAAAVRAAVEADPNGANSPAQHEYKMAEWTIYGACYNLIDKGCRGWRLIRELVWAKEKPTKEGSYWMRLSGSAGRPVVRSVYFGKNGSLYVSGGAGPIELDALGDDNEYAGPLPEPKEPTA